jgi:hypothetical protein
LIDSNQQPAASVQQIAASSQCPADSSQQPAASNQQPAGSIRPPAISRRQPATSNQHPLGLSWQLNVGGRRTLSVVDYVHALIHHDASGPVSIDGFSDYKYSGLYTSSDNVSHLALYSIESVL